MFTQNLLGLVMKQVSNFQLLLTALNTQHRIMSGLNFLKREDNDLGLWKKPSEKEPFFFLRKTQLSNKPT